MKISVLNKADSLVNYHQQRIDSLQQKIDQLTNLRAGADSSKSLQNLKSKRQALQNKADSLNRMGQPTVLVQKSLDSLNNLKPLKKLDSLNHEIVTLQRKIQDPVNKIENSINDKVQSFNKITDNQFKTGNAIDAPKLNETSLNTPTLNGTDVKAPDVNQQVQDVKAQVQIPDELKQAQEQLGKVSDLSSKVDTYQNEVQQIKEGGLKNSTAIDKLAEDKISEIKEVGALQQELGKANMPSAMDEEAAKNMLKEQGKEEVMKLAKDHFAGKQEALTAAMQKMSDLKLKYESLDSLNVPKSRANPMKAKPFVERLVPGLSFQVQKSQHWLIDINPSLAYRITDRWSAGLGWNQRLGYAKRVVYQEQESMYGPRMFAEFRWNKGISFRLEGEFLFGIPVPSFANAKSMEDPARWVNSAFVGIKKDYRIVNRLKGTLFVLYMIYDDNLSSPYANKLNTRFGFEYTFKSKKK
ncbi:hypothetical protein [Chryseotalea sanaruensis]|uniref:hypothetical protein n=1 Tax=Chryseotalea sanaruensis TaxID=2482724 RepID=UPI000F8C5A46|nr:hypothetical protein [Chryseotalea sanaruensis]